MEPRVAQWGLYAILHNKPYVLPLHIQLHPAYETLNHLLSSDITIKAVPIEILQLE